MRFMRVIEDSAPFLSRMQPGGGTVTSPPPYGPTGGRC